MTDEALEPLDAELDALLASERQAEPAQEALARVWSRVAVAPLPPAGGGHAAGPAGAPATGWLAAHAGTAAAIAFVAGGAAGAALYASVQRPAPARVVYVDRPFPASTAAPPAAPEAWLPTPSASVAPVAPIPAPPRVAPSSSSALFAERSLIDSARDALASGDASRALVLLGDHAHRFPKPQLGEEREALVIQSLVALGRYDEARAAAAKFRAASPGSLFLPAIEASLGSIP